MIEHNGFIYQKGAIYKFYNKEYLSSSGVVACLGDIIYLHDSDSYIFRTSNGDDYKGCSEVVDQLVGTIEKIPEPLIDGNAYMVDTPKTDDVICIFIDEYDSFLVKGMFLPASKVTNIRLMTVNEQ